MSSSRFTAMHIMRQANDELSYKYDNMQNGFILKEKNMSNDLDSSTVEACQLIHLIFCH